MGARAIQILSFLRPPPPPSSYVEEFYRREQAEAEVERLREQLHYAAQAAYDALEPVWGIGAAATARKAVTEATRLAHENASGEE